MERSLKDIESEYEKLNKKFQLPVFEKLIEDFDIDKIAEKSEGILIRDVRRVINDKLSAYLHLFETLLHPSSPPMFVLTFLKNTTEDDKKSIREIYKEIAKLQMTNIKLDTIFNEKNEAEFIKDSFNAWQSLKKKIYTLVEIFEREFEKNIEVKEKSYFG